MRTLVAIAVTSSLAACVTSASWSTSGFGSTSSGATGSPDPKLVALFAKVTWRHADAMTQVNDAFETIDGAGVDAMSMQRTGSPDREWLPGWPYGLEGYALADTFMQGAFNKTWQAQCYADYVDYRRAWKAIDATYRPRLDQLRAGGNYYDRALGLLRLEAEVAQAARAAHAALPAGHPTAWVGLPHEIRVAIAALYRDAGRGYVIARHVASWRAAADDAADRPIAAATVGRPWSSDDAAERDLFCLYGEDLGTQRTPPLPAFHDGNQARRPDWQQPARRARALALVDGAAPAAKAAFAPDARVVPTLDTDTPRGSLAQLYPIPLTSARRQGARVVLTFSSESSQLHWGNCRRTGGIDRIRDDGSVVAHETCDASSESFVGVITATLDDVPASIAFRKGDEILLYGTVAKNTVTSRGNTTRHEVQLTGAHIGYFLRDAKFPLTLMEPPTLDAR